MTNTVNYAWHRRALDSIAHGYLTNEKRPSYNVQDVYPTHLKRGRGALVWDSEGKQYVDFMGGLGTNILGYAQEKVNSAVANQLTQGATLSLASTLEVETAEKLKQLFPFVDAVRFLKTGSEAIAAAVKIARAKSDRDQILASGLHGWHGGSHFVTLTNPAAPIHLSHLEEYAAVIVRPIVEDNSRARVEWLKELREECTERRTLLIFNEIDSGFRFPKYSASALYGIQPDLLVLGGAMANGMPLAAVGGKYSTMNCADYYVSSAFAGESLSLAAAKETMHLLQTKFSVDDLNLRGQDFLDQFNAIWPEGVRLAGYSTRAVFKGEALTRALFFQEACRAGVLFGPVWYFNFPLIDEYKAVLGLCRDILTRIKMGGVKLLGEMPKSR
jgi:glutamate-1-semialdehyde 2,1-aminomutase